MKIGIVTNLYPPFQRGGAEYVVVRTVEALLDAGHEVFVITGMPKNPVSDLSTYVSTQERVYRFHPRNIYFILQDNRYWWPVRLLWHIIDAFCTCGGNEVGRIIQSEKPDIVITHNLKGIGIRIPQFIQKENIPHVHVAHDLQLIYPSGLLLAGEENITFYTKPFYAVYRKVCKWAFGKPDLVIFPSKFLQDAYQKYGFFKDSKIEMIPNPAPKFDLVEKSERSQGSLRLLFVGQLEDHKGIKMLLSAFRKFNIDSQLIIAGEGTELPYIKKHIKDDKRITYLGYISVEQLVNCLEIADALVVPSLCYENSPTVIYEALQAGIPVLAADIGGVGELVENGKNGFLFKPGDEKDLIGAMKQMNDQKDRFGKMREEIKKSVAPYKLETYTNRLMEKLKEVIAQK
ncbi:hypothetical protein COV03_00880 [Candidatus Uhrbacteria bacterium CG10_big_fil_rev_8_21_14_0_10_41_26]|nr:MAG: hypothetical protein COZ45_03545 [Candidatus Uhrbacteria bacterium CG_4_10_14_3_um_filter_41_21]PIZ55107.1 MAG: hypothetical protein COY24_01590 [Candidatus Uhrbacteria bacterium CG_4_10_14_0_2_um_filter_41_21]PJB84437.1 MAG: hypothetical protein CO086_03715 [Candidatus Uhrbacteria bacterium CG_4_9_14_0_8_um_filter_41_16]PJE75307.1 MAG: hypothetical protein COV03_00880 [Candidatus Uhrbacteria bacterium CG10_big_fil_rev_8_21_14_0_10_41_26]